MTDAPSVFDQIRASCASVAAVAEHVVIDEKRIADFARRLDISLPTDEPAQKRRGDHESTAAFVIALDTINFGSGWFPTLAKRPGLSGYRTVAASLDDFVAETGPITAPRLRSITIDDTARIFGQSLDEPGPAELMDLFTTAWHDLADFVDEYGDGSFVRAIERAGGSAARLVGLLVTMPFFRDEHHHPIVGRVLLLKRAQIVVQDLHHAFAGAGPGRFRDRADLTMFADNLVPHVLRIEGVLRFDPALVARIEAVENIPVGSPEEIEIRACGLHAVELLRDQLVTQGSSITAGDLDNVLWTLGGQPHYKAVPRHRSRCVFY